MDDGLAAPPPEDLDGVAFEAVVGVDPSALTDQQRSEWLMRAHRLEARLNAATVAITGAFDANVDWAADGAKSAASWISARSPIGHARAHSDVHTARRLRDCPHVTEAAREGRIGRDHVTALLKARKGLEEIFEACEELLVDEVAECTIAAAHTFLRRWVYEVRARFGINQPDPSDPGGGATRSEMHLSATLGGRWDLHGNLDPETGEIMANALDHQIDAMWRDGVFHTDDGLTQPQRRAIAAVELMCRGARGGTDDGTARPLILGITTIEPTNPGDDPAPGPSTTPQRFSLFPLDDEQQAMVEDAEDALSNLPTQLRIHELSRSGPTTEAALHKWICEGDLVPIVIGPDGNILNMGRRIRLANQAQRRALRARDGGCQFPGCHTGAEYCIPHHIRYWELGGSTDLANLILLCRFHHDAIHKRGFTIERHTDGTVTVERPARTPITPHLRIRAPITPRPRGPTPDELADRRHAKARLRATIEHRELQWAVRDSNP